MITGVVVAAYLAAIVVANLVVATYGPPSTPFVSFGLIAFDLTARDYLHERWRENRLWLRMATLIAAGSILSYLVNQAAGPIAVASFVAFALASSTDAVVYQLLGHRPRLVRINESNVASSAVDSLVFPTIAFGGFLPAVVVGQFLAKVVGGFVWSILFAWLMAHRRPQVDE